MIEVRPLAPEIGAEILGVDVRKLDDAGFETIYRAFLDRNVVVIPSQELTIPEYLAYSARWGRIAPHRTKKTRHPDYPELTVLDSKAEGQGVSTNAVIKRGVGWHTDLNFEKVAAKATQLYAREIPSRGGDTLFANMYPAYDALPEPLKRRIEGLEAAYGVTSPELFAPGEHNRPPGIHPLVRVHPETGRKALYFDPHKLLAILGIEKEEGDALARELTERMLRPGAEYRHKWRVGDIVIWDNRCSVHSATGDFPPDERRLLWRVTIMDPAELARMAAE